MDLKFFSVGRDFNPPPLKKDRRMICRNAHIALFARVLSTLSDQLNFF